MYYIGYNMSLSMHTALSPPYTRRRTGLCTTSATICHSACTQHSHLLIQGKKFSGGRDFNAAHSRCIVAHLGSEIDPVKDSLQRKHNNHYAKDFSEKQRTGLCTTSATICHSACTQHSHLLIQGGEQGCVLHRLQYVTQHAHSTLTSLYKAENRVVYYIGYNMSLSMHTALSPPYTRRRTGLCTTSATICHSACTQHSHLLIQGGEQGCVLHRLQYVTQHAHSTLTSLYKAMSW